jgi:lysozyme
MNIDLLASVLEHEGFREKPYQCSEGVWTIGHGLTYLTESESEEIVANRLEDLYDRLEEELNLDSYLWGTRVRILDVLTEMAFQMGWTGLHKFVKMFEAINNNDLELASREMLDSKWAKQTPGRANGLARKLRTA